jgi:hypothetical protein
MKTESAPKPDWRLAGFFVNAGKCALCGKAAHGNLGVASHLRAHVSAGELLHKPAKAARGSAARYAFKN